MFIFEANICSVHEKCFGEFTCRIIYLDEISFYLKIKLDCILLAGAIRSPPSVCLG